MKDVVEKCVHLHTVQLITICLQRKYYKMVKVSIIMAIYNAEKILEQSLESLVAQTIIPQMQIICVDDFSTDTSPFIIRRYAAAYPSITPIFHNRNEGTLKARRDGVDAALGDYIMFVDSDDMLRPEACEELCRLMDKKACDVLLFGTEILPEKDVTQDVVANVRKLVNVQKEGNLSGDLLKAAFLERRISASLWNKIYRAKLCRQAFSLCPEGRFLVGEDLFITFLCLYHASSMMAVKKVFYCYRIGSGISTNSEVTPEKMRAYCSTAGLADTLKSYLVQEGMFAEYAACWQAYRNMMLGDCIHKWFLFVPAQEAAMGFDRLCRAWGSDVLAEALMRAFYNRQGALAGKINGAETLRAALKPVHTIGTFYYRASNGGVERVMAQLIELWVRSGYEVVLFTDEAPDAEDYQLPRGVRRHVLPGTFSRKEEDRMIRYAAWRHLLKEECVDVVVHHAWLSPALLWDVLAVKTLGIPFIQYTHGVFSCMLPEGDADRMEDLHRLCHVNALVDSIIALSDVNAAFWRPFNLKTIVLANPCHLLPSEHAQAALDRQNVLWVGRISPEKQPLDAIAIFNQVHRAMPNARLRIVGKADEAHQYLHMEACSLVRRLGLEGHVSFEGHHNDMVPIYATSALMLSTSRYEGYPMAISESKVFGLPCVMYDLPYTQFARDNEGVVMVPQGDQTRAARAIIEILKDGQKRHALGAAARKSALASDPEIIRQRWISLFENLPTRHCDAAPALPETIMIRTLVEHLEEGLQAARTAASNQVSPPGLYYKGPFKKLATAAFYLRHYGLGRTLRVAAGKINGKH